MTAATFLALMALIWLLIGVSLAFVMQRHGHDFWVWLALGAVLGPISIPLAIERARFHPPNRQNGSPEHSAGRFDVVAGIDGSPESIRAVESALRLFGGCMTRLTLVSVLDYEYDGSYVGAEDRDAAMSRLEEVAGGLGYHMVATKLLFGRPDRAIMEYAASSHASLVVVGARGHGISEALLGSVARRLVGGYGVPVYIGPRDGAMPTMTGESAVSEGPPVSD